MVILRSQYYGNRYIQAAVEEQGKDAVNNKTKIKWAVGVYGNNGYHWDAAGVYFAINGTALISKSINFNPTGVFPETDVSPNNFVSGTMWIAHDSNGTKKDMPLTFKVAIHSGTVEDHSGKMTLDPIDRSEPTVSISEPSNIGTNSFSISVTSQQTCSQFAWRIKTAGGSYGDWTFKTAEATSYTFAITGLNLNTNYVVQLAGKKKTNGVWGWTAEKSVKTLGYSQIDSAADVALNTSGNASPTIKWTPLDKTFKFKIKVAIGSWSTTSDFISPASTAQQTYNAAVLPLEDIALQSRNSMTAVMTATVETYTSGEVLIGSASKTFNATIPNSVRPNILGVTLSDSATTGFSVYCKTLSAVQAAIRMRGIYGSSIVSVTLTVEGSEIPAEEITTASSEYRATIISQFFRTYGSLPVTVKVTDSRGQSSTWTNTITVYDYFSPSAEMEVQTSDTTITVNYSAKIAAVNNTNAKRITIKTIRTSDETVVDTYSATLASYDYSGDYHITQATASSETFQIELTVTDSRGSVVLTAKTGTILISGLPGAQGIAFFKKAEKEGFWIRKVKHEVTDADYVELAWLLATEWSQSGIYAAGEYVTKSGALYQRIEDMTAAESWNASKYNLIGYYTSGIYEAAGNDLYIKDLMRQAERIAQKAKEQSDLAKDYVIESGTESIGWEYDKYASGKIVLRRRINVGKPTLSAYGSLYYVEPYITLPSSLLTEVNNAQLTPESETGLWSATIHSASTSRINYYLANSKSTADNNVYVNFLVEGKWK